jgi:hypothetical protein
VFGANLGNALVNLDATTRLPPDKAIERTDYSRTIYTT